MPLSRPRPLPDEPPKPLPPRPRILLIGAGLILGAVILACGSGGQSNVVPGSYCHQGQHQGTTKQGAPMVCATAPGDPQYKWRPM